MKNKTMCPTTGKLIDNPYSFAPGVGTVSEGTMRNSDLIPAFYDVYCMLNEEDAEKLVSDVPSEDPDEDLWPEDDHTWWTSEAATELCNDLIESLDGAAPTGLYFGTHHGDGANFGFWPCEGDLNYSDAPVVSDTSEIKEPGEYMMVNERGNVTLYVAEVTVTLHEVWSCV